MTWLNDEKGKIFRINGVTYPQRKTLNLTAPGATAADNSTQERTDLDITGLAIPQYDAMADLQAVAPVDDQVVFTRGYSTPLDGGGGTWIGVTGAALSTYTHNGGTVYRGVRCASVMVRRLGCGITLGRWLLSGSAPPATA